MQYPKINLSLEALLAKEGETLHDLDLEDFDFHIDYYHPQQGGSGYFYGQEFTHTWRDLNELGQIVINQADLPAKSFYYQDAWATCRKVEAELQAEGIQCQWEDQLIFSSFTGKHPARARVCHYHLPDYEQSQMIAVLRDGTTIAHFQLWPHA